MNGVPSRWVIEYYSSASGKCDVLEYINGLQEAEQAQIARTLQLLEEFGLDSRVPNTKPLTGHKPLWELCPGANRVIYFAHTGYRFILLVAFRKKSYHTKRKYIELAERRRLDLLEREE